MGTGTQDTQNNLIDIQLLKQDALFDPGDTTLFDANVYWELLPITVQAARDENKDHTEDMQKETAKKHAIKLAMTFNTSENAKKYLEAFKKRHADSQQPVHDACLFTLPTSPTPEMMKLWRALIKKHNPSDTGDKVMRLLGRANEINQYVTNNKTILEEKAKTAETKKSHPDPKKQEKLKATEKTRIKAAIQLILSENTPLDELEKYSLNAVYKNADKNRDAAKLYSQYQMTEAAFDTFISLTPQDDLSKIPDIRIECETIAPEYAGFVIKKLPPSDPRAGLLGEITFCCQSISKEGHDCAIDGITNPESGFYVLEDKKGNIVAQSWVRRCGDKLLFDSIELHMDFEKHYPELASDYVMALSEQLVTAHPDIDAVLVGQGMTPKQLQFLPSLMTAEQSSYKGAHSDSQNQYVIAASDPELQAIIKDAYRKGFIKNKLRSSSDSVVQQALLGEISTLHLLWLFSNDISIPRLKNITEDRLNSLKTQNQYGDTPLHWAATPERWNSSAENLLKLFPEKRDQLLEILKIPDQYGYTPLHWAATPERWNSIEKILKLFPENDRLKILEIRDQYGDTLLHWATSKARWKIIENVLNLLSKENQLKILETRDQYGDTLLYFAASEGRWDDVENFLKLLPEENRFKALNTKHQRGTWLLLDWATYNKEWKIIENLLKLLPENDRLEMLKIQNTKLSGFTLTHDAASEGRWDGVENLLKLLPENHRLKILEIRENSGGTTLYWVASTGRWDNVEKLLKLLPAKDRYDLLKIADNNGNAPLHLAAYKGRWGDIENVLKLLPENDRLKMLKIQNRNGDTLIHLAASNKRWSVIDNLLRLLPEKDRQNILKNRPEIPLASSHRLGSDATLASHEAPRIETDPYYALALPPLPEVPDSTSQDHEIEAKKKDAISELRSVKTKILDLLPKDWKDVVNRAMNNQRQEKIPKNEKKRAELEAMIELGKALNDIMLLNDIKNANSIEKLNDRVARQKAQLTRKIVSAMSAANATQGISLFKSPLSKKLREALGIVNHQGNTPALTSRTPSA